MFDPIRPQFGRRTKAPARDKRLGTERLEDRLLMAADSSSDSSALINALMAIDPDETPVLVTSAATQSAAAAADTSATLATSDDRALFGSDSALKAWLMEAAMARYGHLFGQTYGSWNWGYINFGDLRVMPSTAVMNNNDYSSTNLQKIGVDEADLIETDGRFLYIISGEELVIVRAGTGDDLQVMSRFHVGGRPAGMFLSGNRLTIVSTQGQSDSFASVGMIIGPVEWTETQNYRPTTTTVTILDVENRAAPSLVQKADMDGQLIASRAVNGELRLVVSNQLELPPPNMRPTSRQLPTIEPYLGPDAQFMVSELITANYGSPYWGGEQYVYETKDEYFERLFSQRLDSFLPQIRQMSQSGEVLYESRLVDAANLHHPDSSFDQAITTIATFDLASNRRGPTATENVVTFGTLQVHATTDSIYLFSQKAYESYTMSAPRTIVWKFHMAGGRNGIHLAAKGSFDGAVMNQFSADEHDGLLRVVTDPQWSGAGHSLYVLKQVGRKLEVVGSVSGIALDERLYAVRFFDDSAFFVTFRQVDPLFAVDLSDPTNPQLMGELHIPGYSDYLQPIDDSHLLAIGRAAEEATGLFEELQVSIFDTSDLANPTLLHRYSFDGGRSTATPATGNRWTRGDGDHHAVSYFADEQILAIPVFTAEMWSVEDETLFPVGKGGLQVFRIDVDSGFTPIGLIEHDTLVERSARIGDHLYAISSGAVTVHDIDDPTTKLGEISIAGIDEARAITPVALPGLLLQPLRLKPVQSLLTTTIQTEAIQEEAIQEETSLPQAIRSEAIQPLGVESVAKPEPIADWSLQAMTTRQQSARPVAQREPAEFRVFTRVDAELINLLAVHSATRESGEANDFAHSMQRESMDQQADELEDSILSGVRQRYKMFRR